MHGSGFSWLMSRIESLCSSYILQAVLNWWGGGGGENKSGWNDLRFRVAQMNWMFLSSVISCFIPCRRWLFHLLTLTWANPPGMFSPRDMVNKGKRSLVFLRLPHSMLWFYHSFLISIPVISIRRQRIFSHRFQCPCWKGQDSVCSP